MNKLVIGMIIGMVIATLGLYYIPQMIGGEDISYDSDENDDLDQARVSNLVEDDQDGISTENFPPVVGDNPSYKVGIFYYPWYGNPEDANGKWVHWGADGNQVFDPPLDISSDFYPVLGAYSSVDTQTVAQHFAWLREAGVGVIISSWWAGEGELLTTPILLDVAEHYGLKVTFHIEPHDGYNSNNLVRDVKFLYDNYGEHPAFFRTTEKSKYSPDGKSKGMFYVWSVSAFEEADISAWNQALDEIHGSEYDSLLFADGGDIRWVEEGHFDGAYHYVSTDFTWANKMPADTLYIPSVGPGFQAMRIEPENGIDYPRKDGKVYNEQWEQALGQNVEPKMITITSFNEWHEGTQIEPAKEGATNGKGYTYRDYGSLGEKGYLELTRKWVDKYLEMNW
jgi:glycoprotein endo-alpha-1,2-mannosidase